MDKAALIEQFLRECYEPRYATSFCCYVEALGPEPDPRYHTHLLRPSVDNPFAGGTTRAHVFSVTKSLIGLFWARMIYNFDGLHPHLYARLGSADKGTMGNFLDMRNPVRVVEHVADRPLHRYLTMTSGVATGSTDALYIANIRTLQNSVSSGLETLHTFGSVIHDGYYDRVAGEGKWRYSDACMQIATEAAEEYERAVINNDALTARDVILSKFFPPWLRQHFRETWPMLYTGYDAGDEGHAVYNTIGFYGLRMTGLEMRDLAVYLLQHHLALLRRIWAETTRHAETGTGDGYAVTLTESDEADRHGWRYWCFWWIPICLPNETGTCARGQWISAIGHMGQYILFELTERRAFIRQHFVRDELFENIDVAHVDPKKARAVRMPEFVTLAQGLHERLGVAPSQAAPAPPPQQTDTGIRILRRTRDK